MPDDTVMFMSREHVERMNTLLAGDDEVLAACRGLERPVLMVYELSNGPGADNVYWSVAFDATGVRFGHGPTTRPADVTLVGDWATVVAASAAARAGSDADPALEARGDLGVLDLVATPLAAARAVATVDVRFPSLSRGKPSGGP